MKRILLIAVLSPLALPAATTTTCEHPAAASAVAIIERALGPDAPEVRLEVEPSGEPRLSEDGYVARREGGAIVIRARRPRGLLYAAGEPARWRALRLGDPPLVRVPAFRTRSLNYTGRGHSVAEWVAATGANMIQLGRKDPPRLVEECKAADVQVFAFLYGCDPMKWGKGACEAFLADHPSAKGTDPGRSWEKGIMCPSDPATWQFFASVITNLASRADYDGVSVTFWDDYGLNCHCKRCKKAGLDKFDAQVAAVVKCFEEALRPLGKKLLVRTWSSGAPHFLEGEWVHAPGYGGAGGSPMALWGKTYRSAARDTIFQTKVYNCDCQPNAPFSLLLGHARKAGLCEIAEWQITGQTLGLGYLPASVVGHTAATMRQAHALTHGDGVCLYAGGYNNAGYEALDDVMNSINIYAWRQLSWDPGDNLDRIWLEWAGPIFSRGARDMVEALKRSEMASTAAFSPLGFGTATESRYDNYLTRREDHIRYTNRHYLPEGQALLAPTRENVARVVAEKDEAIRQTDEMLSLIARAAAAVRSATGSNPDWLEECTVRTTWLRTCLVVARALDGAYWRFRYLRYLSESGIADLEVMKEINADFDTIRENHTRLFEHSPELRLSFYGKEPCGEREITLRSPVPLMRDIHSTALNYVERIVGPLRK